MNLILLGAFSDFCSEMSGILKIVGYVVTFFKVAIPLIIVILGMIDLGKAVVASDEDQIKKSGKQIAYRLAAGIIIFFIPTLVLWVFKIINDYNDSMDASEFNVCQECVLHPRKCQADSLTD